MNQSAPDQYQSLRPMSPGQILHVDSSSNEADGMVLMCEQTSQRIWSVVGSGCLQSPGQRQSGKRVFFKQFLDCSGNPHPRQWENEAMGQLVAAQALRKVATVPELIAKNRSHLIHIYEYLELASIDEILRTNPNRFLDLLPHFLCQVESVLRALNTSVTNPDFATLTHKKREYGDNNGLCFKGLDVRNFGFQTTDRGGPGSKRLVVFDFGKPYIAPMYEAAAKIFVSIGLLNWGRPVSRFARGPDLLLLDSALNQLGEFLHPHAVQLELDMQDRFRSQEIRAASAIERIAKQTGIKLFGNRYFKRLRNWCEENIHGPVKV